ncbi:hypothetical protein Tco_1430580 [Tanacetum coccineum]
MSHPRFVSSVLEHLLATEYSQDHSLRSTPSILSNLNYSKNASEVTGDIIKDSEKKILDFNKEDVFVSRDDMDTNDPKEIGESS